MGRRHRPFISILLAVLVLASSASAGKDAAPGQSLPVASDVPTITGSTVEGQTLSATSGTWSGPSPNYAFQWLRCNTSGAACTTIAGATSSTHILRAADIGTTIRVTIIAS